MAPRPSNLVLTILNTLTLLAGLTLFATGIYLSVTSSSSSSSGPRCQTFLRNSLLILGSFVLLVSVLGLLGSSRRNNVFLWLYTVLLLLLVVGAVGFTVFMLVVTKQRHGGATVGDFSGWMRHHFAKGQNWDVVRSCLVDGKVCNVAGGKKARNSALMIGCCKPPPGCSPDNANETTTAAAGSKEKQGDSGNGECGKWSSDPKKMCYNCERCKAGFLGEVRKQWRAAGVALLCFVGFMVVVLCMAWCAINNNKFDSEVSSP